MQHHAVDEGHCHGRSLFQIWGGGRHTCGTERGGPGGGSRECGLHWSYAVRPGKPEGRATRARPSGTSGGDHGGSLCSSGLRDLDVDRLAATLRAELDRTGHEGEERVVATATDALTGVEVRAALADEDLAGLDALATETLDAEELCVRVATVAGRGRTLLVCHVSPSLVSLWVPGGSRVDGGDLDLGQRLTVALTLAVAGLVLELHDDDLGALGGLDDLGLDRRPWTACRHRT